jgi:hypothetical protein
MRRGLNQRCKQPATETFRLEQQRHREEHGGCCASELLLKFGAGLYRPGGLW